MKNIYFENNTCVNAGGGWGASQRPDLKGFQIYCSQITAPLDSIFIRNNIFYKSRCVLFIDNTTVPTWSYTTSDYNCWYTQNSTDTIAAFWKSNMITTYSGTQFLTYQNSTSQDVHSFMTDPLFINSNLPDYHLTAASPCINTGANTGINTDFDLVPRPQNNLYDIGAYEFGSLTELKKTDNDFAVKIFPNPSKGIFQLDLVGVDVAEVKVCDINGKVVFIQPKQSNNNLFGNKINIDVSQLPQGIYYVCIISNTDVINEKLVLVK